MNHWQESAELLARLSGSDAGEPAALATVVRVVGSAYRRPGAKLLVTGDGGNLGSVSGGCLEADVREVAQRVMESGTARLLHYDTSAGEEEVFGLGMGCRGRVEVLVQPVDVALRALLPRWRDLLAGDARFAVLTVAGGAGSLGTTALVAPDGTLHGSLGATLDPLAAGRAGSWLAAGRSGCEELGGHMVFVEALPPPRHLLICGAGDDAV
ncbi:MAG TPA: XdhC family protein, partial [Thermoanaerobaculia bacterium]|nr:XdhC family protein [Thermoanaerobaculia bacterium]